MHKFYRKLYYYIFSQRKWCIGIHIIYYVVCRHVFECDTWVHRYCRVEICHTRFTSTGLVAQAFRDFSNCHELKRRHNIICVLIMRKPNEGRWSGPRGLKQGDGILHYYVVQKLHTYSHDWIWRLYHEGIVDVLMSKPSMTNVQFWKVVGSDYCSTGECSICSPCLCAPDGSIAVAMTTILLTWRCHLLESHHISMTWQPSILLLITAVLDLIFIVHKYIYNNSTMRLAPDERTKAFDVSGTRYKAFQKTFPWHACTFISLAGETSRPLHCITD